MCSDSASVYSLLSNWHVGSVDLSDLMDGMDGRIAKAREQATSRKDILEKVEKWKFAAEEESWLDEYERVHLFISLKFLLNSVHVLGFVK